MSQRPAEEVKVASISETGRYIAIALVAIGLIGGVPYMIFPVLQVGTFCPATTFARGSTASTVFYVSGITLQLFCYIYLAIGLSPKTEGKPRFKYPFLERFADDHRRLFLISMVCGLGLGGIAWFDTLESYYCLTPGGIFLHPSAFTEVRSLTWDAVAAVQSECRHTKRGSAGGLVIPFRDGPQIWTPLGRGEGRYALTYIAIRKALTGHSYSDLTDFSAIQSECPRNLYLWFASQLGH